MVGAYCHVGSAVLDRQYVVVLHTGNFERDRQSNEGEGGAGARGQGARRWSVE